MTDKIPTRPEEMEVYSRAGFQLIPLYRWDRTSTHKNGKARQDGKRPIANDWMKKLYRNSDVMLHVNKGSNAGVRLTAEQLVVDVDPRNFPAGRDSFKELCEASGLDPDAFPKVITGSGGLHVYMTKPADVSCLDSLEAYPGVEFKSFGRQVVAAGSKHPSGGMYEWDFLGPQLDDGLGQVPERLLNMIRRPPQQKSNSSTEGGEHDRERIAMMLDALDPEDFQDHGKWFTLMQAVHHASAGEARDEFIEWSTRDSQYQDDGWIIGRRWDSLHRQREGGLVTYRTLHKLLLDAGKSDVIPRVSAQEDFADSPYLELPGDEGNAEVPEHEMKGPLSRMNDRYWAVTDGGRFRVMRELYNPSEKRKTWQSMTKNDFADSLMNRRLEKQVKDKKSGELKTELVPIAQAWLQWGHRRSADGVIFDPERDHPGWLNLWTGWAVEPKPGDWSLMKELIRDVLCDRNEEAYEYVLRWMAYMVQKPWEPPEVAICFHGAKGTGKSTLGQALVKIAGRHGLQTSSPGHLTGRFNSHLMDVVMLFADEAVRPGDKDAANMLKALITERDMAYEAKGKDVIRGTNRCHVMMASNDDWFVSATLDDGERRYFVSKVNESRQGDKAFFGALRDQLYNKGGLEGMMHDLQTLDLGDWTPRAAIPNTEALADQKLRNMTPMQQWWFKHLELGYTDFEWARAGDNWNAGEVRAFFQDVKESFTNFCAELGVRANASNKGTDRFFHQELKKVCRSMDPLEKRDLVTGDRIGWIKTPPSSDRARSFSFPSLRECRADFEELLGRKVDWATDTDPLEN